MKPIFLYCLFFLGVAGCNAPKENVAISTITTFPVNDSLTLVSWELQDKLNFPSRIYCYDSILALIDNRNDSQIILLSATDRTIQKERVKKGKGPTELIGPWHLTSMDSQGNFYVYDVVTRDLMRINMANALSEDPFTPHKINLANVLSPALSAELLDDSTLAMSGRFKNYRIATCTTDGKIVDEFGLNPGIAMDNDSEFDEFFSESYQGIIKRKPDGRKYALGCRHSDQIEIFDRDGLEQERFVIGPMIKKPLYKISQGPSMALIHAEDIEAYSTIAVTDKYIIGLFCGQILDSMPDSGYSQTLHVFDWEGRPVARYFLDQPCISIDVAPKSNRLYALAIHPVPEIYSCDLNLP